jgi:branched-chain amino acid aminotransferase
MRTAPSARAAGAGADSAPPLLWVNGRALRAGGAHLSALDRGFTLADGLFETMRAYGGVIFRLDRHLERLHRSARALGIAPPAELGTMVSEALRTSRAAGRTEASVRLTLSRGAGAPGVAPSEGAEPTVAIAIHPAPPLPSALYREGLSACIASGRKNEHAMTAGHKTLAYTDAVVALLEARAAGVDDAIFLDTAGHLSEAASSNIFLVREDVLLTPPVSCGVLPGVTRGAVLEIAPSLGLRVEERVLGPEDLTAAGEAFLTSSLREIVPLVRVDGRAVGRGAPGAVTAQVMAGYADLVRRECRV